MTVDANGNRGGGVGVYGSGSYFGVRGQCNNSTWWGVFSDGHFGATGSKKFVQPHPKDASREIQFVCLEGKENGTYFRGTARIVNGTAQIPIPEEWKLSSEATDITVQVTPRALATLAVPIKTRERIVVLGSADVEFDYFVNGVRRGFSEHRAITRNQTFRPEVRGVSHRGRFVAQQLEILVASGILNADYTPNESTATRLGWKLKEPTDVAPEERWWLAAEERARLVEQREAQRQPEEAGR